MKIQYKETCSVLGRHGFSKQKGLDVSVDARINEQNERFLVTHFAPINSQGTITQCWMQIPVEDLPELIKVLQEIHIKHSKDDSNSSRGSISPED